MAATGGRMATVGAAAALLIGAGAGCAQEYDGADLVATDEVEFAATPEYVAEAIDASSDEAYRYSMSMSLGMGTEGFDAEIATGAVDGDEQQLSMDFGAMFDEMGGLGADAPPELADADLTMEQVIDSDALYIRAPFFNAMADLADSTGEDLDITSQPGGALFGVFDQLGDDWGRVDRDALGDVLPADAQKAMTGGQSTSPDVFLEMLRSTGDVEDLGTDEIDGVTVHGLAADVSFEDMLKAEGVDPGTFEASTDGDEAVAGVFAELQLPLEVWVDDDELIRRITFTLGGEQFTNLAEDAAEEAGEDIPDDDLDELGAFRMGMTMDFTDYGDDAISIEAPADAVDITDDFVAAYDDIYGG